MVLLKFKSGGRKTTMFKRSSSEATKILLQLRYFSLLNLDAGMLKTFHAWLRPHHILDQTLTHLIGPMEITVYSFSTDL